jgi:gliding motility-associated-like protein
VVVTDANGCTATQTFNITQPPALTLTSTQTNVACSGGNTGSASVTAVGGTGVYTYAWSPSGGNAATATGLIAGAYSVLVTDANGCTATQTFNITQPPALTLTSTQTNVACNGGNTGSASVTAAGGTGVYTYAWSPSSGNAATATGLIAGAYSVVVTDANGCTATQTFNITQPNALTLTATQTNVACNGGNTGSASVTATGGTGVYTYAWSPSGGNAATATGLIAGPYSVVVTDANGCTATQTFNITQPPALTLTSTQTNVACNGGNTGSASVTATGGNGAYTYAWSPSGGNAATATGLIAGPYSVVVTDANGCTATQTFNITQPPALTAVTSYTQSTCNNANGSAAVVASGGTGAYTYQWSPSGGTGSTASALIPGIYTVVVTDVNNCTVSATVNVQNASAPTSTITATTPVSCFGGNDGSATVTASGGTAPYTYTWSPSGGTGATEISLIAGNYSVVVTDANGCTTTASTVITEPTALSGAINSSPALCFGGNTGSASVVASGGTAAYSYAWSPSGGNNASASSLIAGSYSVTITDANGCSVSVSTTVTEPTAVATAMSATPALCFGGNTGTATVIASGGTAGYSYAWSPSGGNASTASILLAGNYTVTVTDANGCTTTDTVNVNQPSALSLTTQSTDASCNQSDGSVSVQASGGTGPYAYQWASPNGPATSAWSNIPAGSYTVLVTDANGCFDTISQIVNTSNAVLTSVNSTSNVLCFGANDGAIDILVTGGTPGYTYAWTPNVSSSNNATGIPAGNYTVTVTDAIGCTSSISVSITQPTQLNVSASASATNVCQGTSVTLSSTTSGGTPAYTSVWMPGNLVGNTQTVIPTASTTYTFAVVDANGCADSATVFVRVNPIPVAGLTANVVAGCAPVCVDFTDNSTVTAPGMINAWSWDFGDGNIVNTASPSHCYNTPGNYTVILQVTTTDGCTETMTMSNYINVFAVPVADFNATPQPATMVNNTISFTDQSSNASQWIWSFGDILNSTSNVQNPQFTYNSPECFSVELEVISANGCTDTASDIICIEPDVTIYVPNTFTPDGNGINELFFPAMSGIDPDKYELRIFDRWGNQIFVSTDPSEGWDGTVQGTNRLCQQDTYVWALRVTDLNSKMHIERGIVNLIR